MYSFCLNAYTSNEPSAGATKSTTAATHGTFTTTPSGSVLPRTSTSPLASSAGSCTSTCRKGERSAGNMSAGSRGATDLRWAAGMG